MKILTTDNLKESIVDRLVKTNISNKVLLISRSITEEEAYYKNAIIKRCKEFDIAYMEKDFNSYTNKVEIVDFINAYDDNDGFIIFLPFGNFNGLDYLKEEIHLRDLDGFTYMSQGKASNGDYKHLPATPKAVVKFLESHTEITGKNIVIANRSNLIGIPLANYLSKNHATVTVINSKTKNSEDIIKNSDIFISAIGKANFYDKAYFRDGQLLIDVGTSEVNGKIVGDIDFNTLDDLDIEIVTNKKGIGAITTLALLEGLLD